MCMHIFPSLICSHKVIRPSLTPVYYGSGRRVRGVAYRMALGNLYTDSLAAIAKSLNELTQKVEAWREEMEKMI